MNEARTLMKRSDILALQETHMNKEEMEIELATHSEE